MICTEVYVNGRLLDDDEVINIKAGTAYEVFINAINRINEEISTNDEIMDECS